MVFGRVDAIFSGGALKKRQHILEVMHSFSSLPRFFRFCAAPGDAYTVRGGTCLYGAVEIHSEKRGAAHRGVACHADAFDALAGVACRAHRRGGHRAFSARRKRRLSFRHAGGVRHPLQRHAAARRGAGAVPRRKRPRRCLAPPCWMRMRSICLPRIRSCGTHRCSAIRTAPLCLPRIRRRWHV